MAAGTRVMRTTNASTRTPTASARPISLVTASGLITKAAKTLNMISAAAVTTRALSENPVRTDSRASPVWTKVSRIRETRKTS